VKPVTVNVTVPQPREEVYALLDVLGAHEAFTDHFLVDWETSGPRSGVGARARMRVKKPGPPDRLDMEVVAAERPRTTVEESVSANGRRRTRGTYVLEELPGGGTKISFELAWLEAPLSERFAAPLTRWVVRRNNEISLRRLAEQLSAQTAGRRR
jgi:hypothetical protein